jgi:TonB family protein
VNKNNKYIIGFTCVISIFIHLILGFISPVFPKFTAESKVTSTPATFTLKLKAIYTEPKTEKTPLPKPVAQPKEHLNTKKETKLTKELQLQENLLTLHQTSRKILTPTPKKHHKNTGFRRKGNTLKANKIQQHPKKQNQQTNTVASPRQSFSSLTNKSSNKLNGAIKLKNKGNIKLSKTISLDTERTNKTAITHPKNPVFDAIQNASASKLVTPTFTSGTLTLIDDEELSHSRIGDPLSEFEHQQRQVFNQFLAVISQQVEEQWEEPHSNELLLAQIRIYLTKQGILKDIYITKPSGDNLFDQRAIDAVKAVEQFNMPPHPVVAGYFTRLTMTIDNYSDFDE